MQRDLLERVYRARGPLLDAINRAAPWHAIYRWRTLELLSPFLTPATRMLDLAAGTGIFGLEVARHVSSLTLLDALPGMLDTARTNFEAAGLLPDGHRIRFLQHDLTGDDDNDPQIYDLIILTQSLNFMTPLEGPFRYVERHLAPDGLFYFDIDTAFRWAVIEALSTSLLMLKYRMNFSNWLENQLSIGWLRLHLHDVYRTGSVAKTSALVRRCVAIEWPTAS